MVGTAQTVWPKPLVGFLGPNDPAISLDIRGFLQGLHELGYDLPVPPSTKEEEQPGFRQFIRGLGPSAIENRTYITLVTRFAMGDDTQLPTLAKELVNIEVGGRHLDVIVATSTMAVAHAMEATSTIPIVIGLSADPLGAGLVKNLDQPGENVTGLSEQSDDLHLNQLRLLLEINPDLRRVAAMFDGDALHSESELKRLAEAAETLSQELGLSNDRSFRIDQVNVRDLHRLDMANAFARAMQESTNAVVIVGAPVMALNREMIISRAREHRLPVMWGSPEAARQGILVGYGPPHVDIFRRAAYIAHEIVSPEPNADPGSIPIERNFQPVLVVNLQAAADIGIEIPQSILDRAEVIPLETTSAG
jgi:putative tryptophan/tyrosine transport system substrate-binding protein